MPVKQALASSSHFARRRSTRRCRNRNASATSTAGLAGCASTPPTLDALAADHSSYKKKQPDGDTPYLLHPGRLLPDLSGLSRDSRPRETSVMTGPAGQPTEAVFGIFRDLLNLLRDKQPDYLAAAFDGPGPVFRSEIFAEYKATRKEMPVDLVPQIPVIRRVFEGFRVPVFMEPMMEADDVIATLARRGEERGLDVLIVTADKDARQLISDQIRIYNIRKNKVMDAAGLEEDWGIRPDQVVDYLALTGDSVDNVPGVPGIGPGFASTFLKEFGTLDNLLENPGRVKGPKKQQALARAQGDGPPRPPARRARKTIFRSSLDWDALKTQGPDVEALKALCDRVRVPSISRRARKGRASPQPAAKKTWEASTRRSIRPRASRHSSTSCAPSRGSASTPKRPSIDPLAGPAGRACRSPGRPEKPTTCRSAGPSALRGSTSAETLEALRPILTDPAVEKVGQNIKYDMLALGRAGLEMAGPFTDTMILSLPARKRRAQPQPRPAFPAPARPRHDSDLRLDRQRQEPVAHGPGRRRAGRRIRRRRRRRHLANRSRSSRPRCSSEGLWKLYAELERPLDLGAGANGEGRDRRRRAAAQAALARIRRADRRRSKPRSMPWPAAPSTSIRGLSSARCSSTSSSCRRCRRPPAASRARRRRCSRSSRSSTPFPRF